jgi:inner membrane transporter RhtA
MAARPETTTPAGSQGLAIAAALGALISLQTGAAFAKSLFPAVGAEGVAALRIGLAAILLGLALRPWRLRLDAAGWRNLFAYGAMLGLMNILIYRAFATIPLGIAISIEVLGPLGVALLASRRGLDLLWIALALAGLVLLPLGAGEAGLDWRGMGFALAAALCWGVYVAVGGRVAHLGGQGVAAGMAIAALLVVPLGAAHAGRALLTPDVLATGLVIALLSSALPFLLDIHALRRLPQKLFGVLMSASPAVSALAGLLVLGEALHPLQWAGIAAITAACAGSALAGARAARPD